MKLLIGILICVTAASASVQPLICFPHTSGTIPERRGQITYTTTFGIALAQFASKSDVNHILEIGTWYGGGSTDVMAKTLNKKDTCLSSDTHHCCSAYIVTFEVYEPAWEYAARYLQNDPVWLILGTTVGVEDMLKPQDVPNKDQHYQLYYERDRAIMASQQPKLEGICRSHKFDLALIDGNEYTGWGEFVIVRDVCKPKYIALHDTNTLKTHKIETYMRSHPDQFNLIQKGCDEACWAIYLLIS